MQVDPLKQISEVLLIQLTPGGGKDPSAKSSLHA